MFDSGFVNCTAAKGASKNSALLDWRGLAVLGAIGLINPDMVTDDGDGNNAGILLLFYLLLTSELM